MLDTLYWSGEIDAQVVDVRMRRQHDEPIARGNAVRVEDARDAPDEKIRDARMPPVEHHERGARILREDLREQRVVVRMHLEQ